MSLLRHIAPACLALLLILTSGVVTAACAGSLAHLGGDCAGHAQSHDHAAPVAEEHPSGAAQMPSEPEHAACTSLSCMALALLPEAPQSSVQSSETVATRQVADLSTLLEPGSPDKPPIL